jgi:microcystin-dependent protein
MKIKSFIIAVLMMIGIVANAQDAYIAEIRLFAGNFAPQGWAFCDGQTLSISQNQALFALIGVTYGGDGRSTFKLPDLRGRVPIHAGFSQAPGLSQVILGEQGGTETNTITPSIATLSVTGVSLDTKTTGRDGAPSVVQTVVVNNVSQNQELKNRPPYLGLNYIICLQGIFPSRN